MEIKFRESSSHRGMKEVNDDSHSCIIYYIRYSKHMWKHIVNIRVKIYSKHTLIIVVSLRAIPGTTEIQPFL